MRKVAWIVLGSMVLLYVLMREFYFAPSPDQAETLQSEAGNREALRLVRDEPDVKQALITDANVLYVSVYDDGTRRDQYASYLCGILKAKKANVNSVKVVKLRSTNERTRDAGYGIVLGESDCQLTMK